MIQISNKQNCVGCYACAEICPTKCILLKPDNEGFYYPIVDTIKCINCHQCEKVCPVINQPILNTTINQSYAAINTNAQERNASSSGGIFTLFAQSIIQQEGIVYGVGYTTNWDVIHKRITQQQEILELTKSKYVQSQLKTTYSNILKDLTQDKIVLFIGTPCQVAGLKNYLKKDYEKLLCLDFICHGVPSPKMWKYYLEYTNMDSIDNISFRDKSFGWKKFSMRIESQQKVLKEKLNKNLYLQSFLLDLSLRPSCYQCKFKTLKRSSDITLGDYWNYQDRDSQIKDDDKGISAIQIHSTKGLKWFKSLDTKNIHTQIVQNNDIIKNNSAMLLSVKQPKLRSLFFYLLNNKQFHFIQILNYYLKIYKKIYRTIKIHI